MPRLSGRGREPIFNLPVVVTVSVAVMVAIHAIRMALPEEWDDLILGLFAFAPDRYIGPTGEGAAWPGGVAAQIWSPFTYALLHNDLLHLVSNCAVFASLGNVLARRMTAARFLLFCVVMAPLSAIGELIIAFYQSGPVIGVSGVICAMMGALGRFAFPAPVERAADLEYGYEFEEEANERMSALRPVDAPQSVPRVPRRKPPPPRGSEIAPILETLRRPKVIQFILGFAAMNIVLVVAAPVLVGGGAGVAWMVHVAGFVAGFLLMPRFDNAPMVYVT